MCTTSCVQTIHEACQYLYVCGFIYEMISMNDYPVITCLAQVFYHNIIINNKTGPRFIGIGELDKGNELRGLKTKGS